MLTRTSIAVAALALAGALGFWQTRSAGQATGPAAGDAHWLTIVDAWDAGDYPTALAGLRALLQSPAAGEYLERAALVTGELFVTTDLTTGGRNPAVSADGRFASFEIGSADEPVTRVVRLTDGGAQPAAEMAGGGLVFSPRGASVVWMRGNELVVRDLDAGREQVVATGSLLKTEVAWNGDGTAVLFVGADPADLGRSDVYSVTPGAAPRRLTSEPGFKTNVRAGTNGRTLLYQVTTTPTFRAPGAAVGGGRGAGRGGRGGGAAASYGLVDLSTGAARSVDGLSLVLSTDGSTIAWLASDGTTTSVHRAPALGGGAGTVVHRTTRRVTAPALSPDGSHVAFQMMPHLDWEIFVAGPTGEARRLTHDIQHDVLPAFLTNTTLLAMMGEARHRRSHVYDVATGARTRVFDNNVVRTISPEYVWVPSANGRHVMIQADRDGDTVSTERWVSVVDLGRRVTLDDVRARVARQLASETALRQRMTTAFAPVADLAREVVGRASVNRVYAYQKALFDFGSKHVTQPGNAQAIAYLERTYRSFGYTPDVQAFDARGNRSANVLATLRGTVDPHLIYVVSSHFDSVAGGPGADDNTSGTAALLEAARVLSTTPLPATIVFASFTGEEAGLLGSREFVRQAEAANWQVVGALNNDMIGWAGESGRMDNTIRYSNAGIKDLQHGAAFLFTNLITYDAKYYRSTDAAAFYEAWGDIVGGIGSYPVLANPNYHQATDFLETINHQQVTETAKVTAATLVYLASSPSRITDLAAQSSDTGVDVTWARSPESGIRQYVVAYGPADDPMRTRVTSPQNAVRLPRVPAGTHIAVQAVNDRGLDGWDWARVVLQ
ncbi:MAG TPA: M20/M25/M40 family metallo-hydrolase [Vicinamibacterales bacterium]|nr:M20/M25/M40 family metallo-hydrolase [Vicinamibacterales bacterium]